MAVATVTRRIQTNNPNSEAAVLTLSDGETYVSQKFGTITAAIASGNQDNDAHINVTYTGGTATVNYDGMTNQLVTLKIWGIKS